MLLFFQLGAKSLVQVLCAPALLLIALVPLRQYRQTKEQNFLFAFFILFFLFSNLFLIILREFFDLNVLLEQFVQSSGFFLWFTILNHITSIKWEKRPKLLYGLVIAWLVISHIFILNYSIIKVPEVATVLFFLKMRTVGTGVDNFYNSEELNQGVGFMLDNGTVMLSHGYEILFFSFVLFVCFMGIYVYLTTSFPKVHLQMDLVRALWVITFILLIFHPIVTIGYGLYFWDIFQITFVTNFLAFVLLVFIFLKFPECILMNQTLLIKLSKVKIAESPEMQLNKTRDAQAGLLKEYYRELVEAKIIDM